MYGELVKRLREPCQYENCILCQQAADAIEGLSHAVDQMTEWRKNQWISVTERLPEAESGDVSKPVLVTDGDCMAIAEWFNFELSGPFWSYTGIGDITHWQPLPEPPKEESYGV